MENTIPSRNQYIPVTISSGFFSKVIFCFGLALLVSAAGVYTSFQYVAPLSMKNQTIIWVLYALELILVFTSRLWSTYRPLNYFLFAFFAFLTGITISPLISLIILQFDGPMVIIKALAATMLAFSAAAIYGTITRRILTGWKGFLLTSLIGMIIVAVIGVFIPWSSTFETIFSGFGVLLFVGYTMYDFQRLKAFPEDRYLDAAMKIYLDIFNLFLFVLRLISGTSRH